jgi:hypothetical protein
MLSCALQLQRLTTGEFVPLDERLGVAVPHWKIAIEAKTGLTNESASAVSQDWRRHEQLLSSGKFETRSPSERAPVQCRFNRQAQDQILRMLTTALY